jgi:hypothetical protein
MMLACSDVVTLGYYSDDDNGSVTANILIKTVSIITVNSNIIFGTDLILVQPYESPIYRTLLVVRTRSKRFGFVLGIPPK